jgi:hypothetical protein
VRGGGGAGTLVFFVGTVKAIIMAVSQWLKILRLIPVSVLSFQAGRNIGANLGGNKTRFHYCIYCISDVAHP